MTVKLYLGADLISGGATEASGISANAIATFLIVDGAGDWCGVADDAEVTGQVFQILIGEDFDDYADLTTAAAIAANPGALALVLADETAQGAVKKSAIAKGAGLLNDPIDGVAIGDFFMGGFFVGVMDSTQSGAILANDQSKTGIRYALIDLGAASEPGTNLMWKNARTSGPPATQTMWDGHAATQAMIAAGAEYPAAQYAAGYSVPTDDASAAYIGAPWELLAAFTAFKPMTENNYLTAETDSTFPGGTVVQGYNPLVDPQQPAFTATVPGQTSLTAFKTGGAQAYQDAYYWTSAEYSTTFAWSLYFGTGAPGGLYNSLKDKTNRRLRLFRRLILPS